MVTASSLGSGDARQRAVLSDKHPERVNDVISEPVGVSAQRVDMQIEVVDNRRSGLPSAGAGFDHLARNNTLVVPDLLGFGRSLDEQRPSSWPDRFVSDDGRTVVYTVRRTNFRTR